MDTKRKVRGMEINVKLVGALFAERYNDRLNVFCLYLNGDGFAFDVPVAQNLNSVDELFRKLDMFGKCNSAIVEHIVRGRVYVQNKKGVWMYTLLDTVGSTCPKVDASIDTLGWKVVWSARDTEILKLESFWGRNYCYAVRSHIAEAEVTRTLHESKALYNPTVPRRRGIPKMAITAVVAAVAVL